jgi:DNA-binding CsgD family transcriptional regulator
MPRVNLADRDSARASGSHRKSGSDMRPSSSSEAEELSRVIGTVYDAALDPELWPEAIRQACTFLNCMAGAIGAIDLLGRTPYVGIQWGYDADRWQSYLDRYFHANLLNAECVATKIGQVLRSTDFTDFAAFLTSEFYKEWVEPQGVVDGIQGTLDKTASSIALMTYTRHKSVGMTTPTEARRMNLIVPHFRRSFLISRVIEVHKVTRDAFAKTIDGLTTAVFLVSGAGKIVHANPSGQAMLADGDPLAAVRDKLMTSNPKLDRSLRSTFASAAAGEETSDVGGAALPLFGRKGDPYIAHVLPLTAGARQQAAASYSAVAALFVRRTDSDLPTAINAASELYGLTAAETRVLRGVIEVGGVAPVATLLGSSQATVKTHLQNLFAKTGTRRQAELVRLVVGFESPARVVSGS